MFMKSTAGVIATALMATALFGSAPANAAKETFQREKPHVNVGTIGDTPALAIDFVVVDSEGRTEGAIASLNGLGNLTLKRSIVRVLPEDVIEAAATAQIAHQADDGSQVVSDLTVEMQRSRGGGDDDLGGGDIILVDLLGPTLEPSEIGADYKYVPIKPLQDTASDGSETGDMLLFASTAPDSTDTIEEVLISFDADSSADASEQLWGEPAYLFNTPGPGETLVATIPMPPSGDVFIEDLFIYSSERTQTGHVQLTILVNP